jgi:hypothetical protein
MPVLRWQQAEGQRHALRLASASENPQVDVPFDALCGETVTPRRRDLPSLGGHWFDTTCSGCDGAWRATNVTSTGVIVDELAPR